MLEKFLKGIKENIQIIVFLAVSAVVLSVGFYGGVINHTVEVISVDKSSRDNEKGTITEVVSEFISETTTITNETATLTESTSETTTGVIQIDDTPGVIEVPNLVPADGQEDNVEFTTRARKEVESEGKVSLSVGFSTILNNMDKLDKTKVSLISEDGYVFMPTEVDVREGDTVFSLLERELVMNNIHFEYSKTTNVYIEGINNIYEFDCGELSGWMYKVNGEFPSVACDAYSIEPGDVVEWVYTCDLGRDVGDEYGRGFNRQIEGTTDSAVMETSEETTKE